MFELLSLSHALPSSIRGCWDRAPLARGKIGEVPGTSTDMQKGKLVRAFNFFSLLILFISSGFWEICGEGEHLREIRGLY